MDTLHIFAGIYISGWNIETTSDKVKVVVAIEPCGFFYFSEGEAPENTLTNYAPIKIPLLGHESKLMILA